jgi:dTDP-4-amino-4,6-dideoxygalactose transaminase
LPSEAPWAEAVYHLFPVLSEQRDELLAFLKEQGIGVLIHYPVPLHLQPAFAHLGWARGDYPAAEEACNRELSLPTYPELSRADVDFVARAIAAFG